MLHRAGRSHAAPPEGAIGARHIIPYDHAATFRLDGRPGHVVQDVINVGSDGTFVATAISYGFEEDRNRPLQLVDAEAASLPGDITLGQLPLDALIEGFRVSPRHEALWFDTDAPGTPLRDEPLSPGQLDLVLERVRPVRDDLSFLFTLTDSASGRELQDEAALNTASLGSARGERPFRPLAQPVQFLPRSTVRVQVEERSFDRRGTLFIVLCGYKILTSAACPEPMRAAVPAPPQAVPADTAPFDYVARVELTGRPGERLETEVPVSAEGIFVATAIGYGLAPEDRRVIIDLAQLESVVDVALRARLAAAAFLPANSTVALGDVPLRCFDAAALRDGIRLRPDFVHLALGGGGLATLGVGLIDSLFETLNRPEDVSFRYSLHDSGVGTDLQNQPLNNLAGLGRADGDRPFKRLHPPMQLFPGSTLRLSVQQHSGRGMLFVALHGFKRLGVGAPPSTRPRSRRP